MRRMGTALILSLFAGACAEDAAPAETSAPDVAVAETSGGGDGSGGVDLTDGTDGTDATGSTDGTGGTDGTDGLGGTDSSDNTESTDGTEGSDGTDSTDGPPGGTGPACDPDHGYDPTKLDAESDAVLEGLPTFTECGCSAIDLLGGGAEEAAEACLCEAFATCQPARLRTIHMTIEGDPLARDLIVVPDNLGGCSVVTFYDATQDAFGAAPEVIGSRCKALSCDHVPFPEASDCGPLPECGEPPQCLESQSAADTDDDGCLETCCFTDCGPDFVATDVTGDGCADSCADAPCTSAADCQVYQCTFIGGTCEEPVGICSDFACDPSGPVCGCDGETYESGCAANAAGVPVAQSAACE